MRKPGFAQSGDDYLDRLLEPRGRFEKVDVEVTELERRYSAPYSNLKASAAQLIEHAYLLHQAERIVERQQIDQRPQMDPAGARRDRRQKNSRRRSASERRTVMLRQMVTINSSGLGGLDQSQTL